jgi:hypothetical protein
MGTSICVNCSKSISCQVFVEPMSIGGNFSSCNLFTVRTLGDGLAKECRYLDNSRYPVCYHGGKPRHITSCVGCDGDGKNALDGMDATEFAERGNMPC